MEKEKGLSKYDELNVLLKNIDCEHPKDKDVNRLKDFFKKNPEFYEVLEDELSCLIHRVIDKTSAREKDAVVRRISVDNMF